MIVAITIILIVAMICGSCLLAFYWDLIHKEVNEYTLKDVKRTVERIEDWVTKILNEKNENSMYFKGYVDAIDECVFRLETHCLTYKFKGIPVEDIKGILEQLKEKKK